jgi:hypothetical protein
LFFSYLVIIHPFVLPEAKLLENLAVLLSFILNSQNLPGSETFLLSELAYRVVKGFGDGIHFVPDNNLIIDETLTLISFEGNAIFIIFYPMNLKAWNT